MRSDIPTQGLNAPDAAYDDDEGISLFELLSVLGQHLTLLIAGPLLAGLAALGITTYLIAPTFTAATTFLPPQQQQSAAASALAALGPLAGLAGAGAVRTPADQYVALMQSATVSDRLIDQFKLMQAYEREFRVDARKDLAANVRIGVGKKDGLITVEVDDKSPQRAADIANRYVDELRRMTGALAITEAQQRRAFFERQLQQTRDKLTAAQLALQASGFSQGALKAEPKAAAEGYARLRAEVTAAEVRLQTMRGNLVDETPEVRQLQATLSALRAQLAKLEQAGDSNGGPDYVGKYREFKYQETLFELFARQYELARVDESREGALIQVVDVATPPEKKSKPKRAIVAVVTTLGALLLLATFVLVRNSWRQRRMRPR
jgi:capsule polysaccharide export protein KpsE/RkpR